mgnify:CR=1 FL=1
MKYLLSAVLHTFLLVIASIIVMLIAERVSYSGYVDFCSIIENQKVSIASALGICEVGEEATAEEIFGSDSKIVIKLPESVMNFINTYEVEGIPAKFMYLYPFIGICAGLLCLIFGVGLPFRIWRKTSLSNFIFDISESIGGSDIVDYTTVDDEYGRPQIADVYSQLRAGGALANGILSIIFFFLYSFFVVVWGNLMIPIIVIDLVISILIFIVKFIISFAHSGSAKQNA